MKGGIGPALGRPLVRIVALAVRSYAGCVVVFTLLFAVPELLYFGFRMQQQGLLTVHRMGLFALGCLGLGIMFSTLVWFVFLRRFSAAARGARRSGAPRAPY